MRTRHVVRCTIATGALCLGIGTTTPPASAAPAIHEHSHEVADVLVPAAEEGPDATFCGLRDVPLHLDVLENYHETTPGSSGFPYASDDQRSTFVWTNPTTGLTLTLEIIGQSRDHAITDNGDGTITLIEHVTGTQKAYGPDGTLLFHDAGLVEYSLLLATMGTTDPGDDEFLGLTGEPVFHGPHPTADRDFCDDFLTATSG